GARGHRVPAVAGVETRRVDHVTVPRPIGKTGRLDQIALGHDQAVIEIGDRRGRTVAARRHAAGSTEIRFTAGVDLGAGLRERVGGRPQTGEVDLLRAVCGRLRRLLLDLADVLEDLSAVGLVV